jgi:hypothetical protein
MTTFARDFFLNSEMKNVFLLVSSFILSLGKNPRRAKPRSDEDVYRAEPYSAEVRARLVKRNMKQRVQVGESLIQKQGLRTRKPLGECITPQPWRPYLLMHLYTYLLIQGRSHFVINSEDELMEVDTSDNTEDRPSEGGRPKALAGDKGKEKERFPLAERTRSDELPGPSDRGNFCNAA